MLSYYRLKNMNGDLQAGTAAEKLFAAHYKTNSIFLETLSF